MNSEIDPLSEECILRCFKCNIDFTGESYVAACPKCDSNTLTDVLYPCECCQELTPYNDEGGTFNLINGKEIILCERCFEIFSNDLSNYLKRIKLIKELDKI